VTVVGETLVVALVAYRVWRFFAVDTLLEKPRGRLPGPVAHWVECPWCAGSWVAIAVAVVAGSWHWIGSDPWFVALAAAAVVGLIGERA
jgi:hypothetical protein